LLSIAPNQVIIPISPKPGKEKETLDLLNDSMKWVPKEEGIISASVYQLAASQEMDKVKPKYLVILVSNNQEALRRLRENPKCQEMQKKIFELSGGLSATDNSVIDMNGLLTGLEG
ncbi:MAG TPA: hypothetical protein VN455_00750, partial [Methanotrichaceae archaeon]|nr:hypothetical protein [Methanotrichaceae archaeon]